MQECLSDLDFFRSLAESSRNRRFKSSNGVVLGIDFGSRQQGLAVADLISGSIQPLLIVRKTSREQAIRAILEQVSKWQPKALIWGCPFDLATDELNPDQPNRKLLGQLRQFIQALRLVSDLPMFLQQEHFSSYQARTYNKQQRLKRSADQIDDLAASVILQHWLVHQGFNIT